MPPLSGITAGCGGGNDCPGDSVTRAQMAAFLSRTFGLDVNPQNELPGTCQWSDQPF